ncbi:MAG: hypothetical protein R3320_01275 [Nitriliruptorales bacterium]|nr:hypothetical protein [Nitriliruptorales bacterium]
MTDFEDALRARLERNDRLAEERARAEEEMDRAAERVAAEQEREEAERRRQQDERHRELADRLETMVAMIRDSAPDMDVRAGWSRSGEEYLAKFATTRKRPRRSLTIELDRDDDEVLARWHSAVGDSLELWHLLEFDVQMLEQLVLQVIDDELWSGAKRPPSFPGASS